MADYTLAQLAEYLQAELKGDGSIRITGLGSLQTATTGQVSFLSSPAYVAHLETTRASAVVLHPAQAQDFAGAALVMNNPYLGFARLSQLFAPPRPAAGIRHHSAVIDPTAELHPSVHVGAGAVIEAGCHIAADVVIGALCYIGADCEIDEGTLLHPRVTLYHQTRIGKRCILHSGAVLGSDGFGFAPTSGDWEKIAQLGRVLVADQVEIGANCTIDRGALEDTVIGRDTKLDNLIHLAHNVSIGEHTMIAACTGVAGSTRIGSRCLIGGHSGITGHIEICDHVQLTGQSMVIGSITQPGSYSSGTGSLPSKQWRKSAARFRQLDELSRKLQQLIKSNSKTEADNP